MRGFRKFYFFLNFHRRIAQYYLGPTEKLKYRLSPFFPDEFSKSAHIVEFKTYTIMIIDYLFRLLYIMSLFVKFPKSILLMHTIYAESQAWSSNRKYTFIIKVTHT